MVRSGSREPRLRGARARAPSPSGSAPAHSSGSVRRPTDRALTIRPPARRTCVDVVARARGSRRGRSRPPAACPASLDGLLSWSASERVEGRGRHSCTQRGVTCGVGPASQAPRSARIARVGGGSTFSVLTGSLATEDDDPGTCSRDEAVGLRVSSASRSTMPSGALLPGRSESIVGSPAVTCSSRRPQAAGVRDSPRRSRARSVPGRADTPRRRGWPRRSRGSRPARRRRCP